MLDPNDLPCTCTDDEACSGCTMKETPLTSADPLSMSDFLKMAESPAPVEARSEYRQLSTNLYEMVSSWVEAGFTRAEAMQMIMVVIASGLR